MTLLVLARIYTATPVIVCNTLTQERFVVVHTNVSEQGRREVAGETMTPRPMDFRGPIKVTLKSEQRLLMCKQRADMVITLEQRSNSNRLLCKQIGPHLWGEGLCI